MWLRGIGRPQDAALLPDSAIGDTASWMHVLPQKRTDDRIS